MGRVQAMMDAIDSLGYWVRRRRKALDLTQDDLAQRVGCAAVTLRKIEADERRPSLQMAQRLAQCLALSDGECQKFIAVAMGERPTVRLPWENGKVVPHRPPGNLPASVVSLIGRSTDCAAIVDCLGAPEVRLLTLTGPVGVGKTCLALEVGRQMAEAFQAGVYLVSLEPIHDPALVPAVTAAVLGVREGRDRDVVQSTVDSLADKEMLVIFDNFEHLLPAAAFLSQLVASCPKLRVLVTSRSRLHLYGEHEVVVDPLALPDPRDLALAADAPAVRLFCRRAQAARADFHLTPSLTPLVVEICQRLDGLPLAIELAAARVRLFSLQELQHRLERRLPLLSQGAADLPSRLQGLETAIAWSYGLLSPHERTLLTRLAVFVNGFSVPAAEAVCDFAPAESGYPPAPALSPSASDLLQGIDSLLDHSLLSRRAAESRSPGLNRACCERCPTRKAREAAESVSRLTMLETIREFALDRLRDTGELAIVQQRHAAYYAAWAEQAESHLHGPDQVIWLAQLERESGNLRAALSWLVATDQLALAAHMACALGTFWQRHGHYSEGRRWLQQILERLSHDDLPEVQRAWTLQAAATLAYRQGDWRTAEQWLMESLALFRAADDVGVARVLFDLGWIAIDRGNWSEGIRLNQESLALAHAVENPYAIYQGLTNLGWAQLSIGQVETAARLFDDALAHARRIGHVKGVAVSLANLSWIALYQADLERTQSLARESLHLCCLLGEQEVLAECMDILAVVAVRRGDACHAAQLGGAAEAMWHALHIDRAPADHSSATRSLAVAAMHRQLGDLSFDQAWGQGRMMTLNTAVALALGCHAAIA